MGSAHSDIHRTHACVIACYAGAAALHVLSRDAWWRGRAHPCRVAPDELLLITAPPLGVEVESRARQYFDIHEPSALVVDQTDGFAAWTLDGETATRMLRHLSVNHFPDSRPAFVQGVVAGAPAKVLLVDGAAHVLVPSPLRDYVASRLRDVAGPFEATAEIPLAMGHSPQARATPRVSPVPEPAQP